MKKELLKVVAPMSKVKTGITREEFEKLFKDIDRNILKIINNETCPENESDECEQVIDDFISKTIEKEIEIFGESKPDYIMDVLKLNQYSR